MTEPEAEPKSRKGAPGEAPGPKSFGLSFLDALREGNTVSVTVLAIVTATVVGGLLSAFTNPAVLHAPAGDIIPQAWKAAAATYVALFEGSIINPHTVAGLFQQAGLPTALHDGYFSAVFNPLSETCVAATPLILAGLAVSVPYQAGMFNIGGQSQLISGLIIAAWLGYDVSLPPFIHVVVCVIGGFVGGAVLGWLVGEIKARTGAHEVIVTIMLNYVMQYLLAFLLSSQSMLEAPGANPVTPVIATNAELPHLFGANLRVNVGFLIALACAFGVWWLMNRTTTGFEMRAVGASASAARVAGMRVERTWVLVMLIAGGLAGLAGSTIVQGTAFSVNSSTYGTYGIDAITVALLGRGKPAGVVWAGLLFGALTAASGQMQSAANTPAQIVQVLGAVIVLFIAAPPLIRTMFRLRAARAGGVGTTLSKGWNA
ncbi:MAG TPA: ABC transporter permease [Trebonia sp.]|jgi:simple sugar transport system permease protein|nr:ABC transporter permease [Trebonia sp.]